MRRTADEHPWIVKWARTAFRSSDKVMKKNKRNAIP